MTERERFEKFCRDENGFVNSSFELRLEPLQIAGQPEIYEDERTQRDWETWQASATPRPDASKTEILHLLDELYSYAQTIHGEEVREWWERIRAFIESASLPGLLSTPAPQGASNDAPPQLPIPCSVGHTSLRDGTFYPIRAEVSIHVGESHNRGNCFATVSLGGRGATDARQEAVEAAAEFIVRACNAWYNPDALRARLRELEAK